MMIKGAESVGLGDSDGRPDRLVIGPTALRLHRARVAPENTGTWQEWPQEAQGLVAEVVPRSHF
jgi:hypothetical protein